MKLSRSTKIFLVAGLVIQLVTYLILPNSILSLVSGVLGVCSVVFGASGNIMSFVFGFAQVGTYTYLCIEERLYAEVAMNMFYFLTMVGGVYVWRGRLKEGDSMEVTTRNMSLKTLIWMSLAVAVLSIVVGWLLARYTEDSQPYLDAITTVPALVAQILMVMVYREQWYLWLLVDILAVVMWWRAGDYCMVAQYAFWCVNCVYGYKQWTKLLKKDRGC
jgi:nicotinamide mononucleotide transporter